MHIQKVLNSSVVLVQDDSGEESILLGKGIGYGRKAGEPIERQPSDRVFLPLSNPDAQPMLELFSSIPASYLELTQDIVDDAEQSLGVKLSAHIYLLLTDHLHFAVERQQKGLVVTNRIFWEIKHFYPKEYAVARRQTYKNQNDDSKSALRRHNSLNIHRFLTPLPFSIHSIYQAISNKPYHPNNPNARNTCDGHAGSHIRSAHTQCVYRNNHNQHHQG